MQKVQEEIFYHVQRGGNYGGKWVVGNTLHFNQQNRNRFFDNLIDSHKTLSSQYAYKIESLHNNIHSYADNFIENLINTIDTNKISHIQNIANSVKNHHLLTNYYSKKFLQVLREVIFEDIRKQYYPEYPSRMHSIWLTSKDYLPAWVEIFEGESISFFKVIVTGNVLKVDGGLIDEDLHTQEYYEWMAKRYWNSASNDDLNKVREEYLFEGEVKIMEEFNNLTEII